MGLTTGIFAKAAGIVVVVGGLTFAGAAWSGSDSVTGAVDKIKEQANELNIFKSNESKLVTKVNELKSSLATAYAKIQELQDKYESVVEEDNVNVETIMALEKQIAEQQELIATLEADLASLDGVAETEAERLMAEVLRLEGELNKANADAELLETAVDEATTVTAMTEAELNEVLEGVPTPPEDAPVTPEEPTEPEEPAIEKEIKLISGTPQALVAGLIINKEADDIDGTTYSVTIENNTSSTWTIEVNGSTHTLANGDFAVVGKAHELDGEILTIKKGSTETKYFLLTNN